MILAAILILLHTVDGHDIAINPAQVTILRAAKPGEPNRYFTEGVRCVISLADGKFVTVRETCGDVRQQMEQAR